MDNGWPHFQMEEHFDDDGALWLALVGELDLAVSERLGARLRELQRGGIQVRLDLSRLEFIDSTGLRELIRAVTVSRRDGWELRISDELTSPVRRVVELVGLAPHLWPTGD